MFIARNGTGRCLNRGRRRRRRRRRKVIHSKQKRCLIVPFRMGAACLQGESDYQREREREREREKFIYTIKESQFPARHGKNKNKNQKYICTSFYRDAKKSRLGSLIETWFVDPGITECDT
jgi:hypothetical protein